MTNVYQLAHVFSVETTLRDNRHVFLICFDSHVNNVLFYFQAAVRLVTILSDEIS